MEASLNEALEKLEGEEHQVIVYQEKNQKCMAEIEDLTMRNEEMTENIQRVSDSI